MSQTTERVFLGIIAFMMIVFLFMWLESTRRVQSAEALTEDRYTIERCIDKSPIVKATTGLGAAQACYEAIRLQGMLDDFRIRRTQFSRQGFDERVILWMVVMITVAGVLLSGLQLLAGYKLSKSAEELSKSGSTLTVESGKVSLTSSIVGVMIFGMSFAFFYVFISQVFGPRDESGKRIDAFTGGPLESAFQQIGTPSVLQPLTKKQDAPVTQQPAGRAAGAGAEASGKPK